MTSEPRHPPIVPSYGAATLADLSSSMLASLDPEAPSAQNVLGLPPARRACLLIVDGLGWELLRGHPAAAPFLSELARNSRPITAGFPSTTVTSLGSICTGRPPGQHGILGFVALSRGEIRLREIELRTGRIERMKRQDRVVFADGPCVVFLPEPQGGQSPMLVGVVSRIDVVDPLQRGRGSLPITQPLLYPR